MIYGSLESPSYLHQIENVEFIYGQTFPCTLYITIREWNAFEYPHVAAMRLIRIETRWRVGEWVARGSMRCGGRMRFKERVEQPLISIVNLGERRRGSFVDINRGGTVRRSSEESVAGSEWRINFPNGRLPRYCSFQFSFSTFRCTNSQSSFLQFCTKSCGLVSNTVFPAWRWFQTTQIAEKPSSINWENCHSQPRDSWETPASQATQNHKQTTS